MHIGNIKAFNEGVITPPLVGSDHDKRFNGMCYGFPKTKPKKTPQKSKLEKPTNIPKIKQSSS